MPLGSKPGTLTRGVGVLSALVALLSLTERARLTAQRIAPSQFQVKNVASVILDVDLTFWIAGLTAKSSKVNTVLSPLYSQRLARGWESARQTLGEVG